MASFEENHVLSQDQSAQAAIENAAEMALAVAAESAAPVVTEATVAPGAAFTALGLAPELVAAVCDLGYTVPTAVQQRTIPLALAGEADGGAFNDLMVSSQTGSGKTAAFLLPMLHTLIQQQEEIAAAEKAAWDAKVTAALSAGELAPKRPRRKNPTDARHFKAAVPGALVLCPTRELAQQVANDAIDLVKHCRGLRVASIVGGMPYQLQVSRLQNANLVVATPGRLLDLQRSGQIKLDQVRFLVMDEADRMLDLGFADDLAEVHKLTAQRQQTMMFSATFAPRIQQLAMRVMHDDGARVRKVQIDSPQEQHANIRQELYWADSADHKRRLLDYWLRDPSIDQAIVFACTQVECEQLAEELQQTGFAAVSLHGALSQAVRNRRLSALREGRVQILVATDVAARGIDVPTITHVINFGLPMKAEDYTHRIGRTGRAGRDGLAITLAEFRDRRRLADIEGHTRQPFKPLMIDGLEPTRSFPPIAQEAPGRKGGGRGGPSRGGPRRSFGGGGDRYGNDRFGGDRFGGESRFEERRGPKMIGGGFEGKSGFGGRPAGAGSSRFDSGRPAPAHRGAARPAARPVGAAPRAAKPYAPKGR